jgi:hypothetical protein
MNDPSPAAAISPLRQRLIDDMNVRRFSRETFVRQAASETLHEGGTAALQRPTATSRRWCLKITDGR